jgi:hypothetical protein
MDGYVPPVCCKELNDGVFANAKTEVMPFNSKKKQSRKTRSHKKKKKESVTSLFLAASPSFSYYMPHEPICAEKSILLSPVFDSISLVTMIRTVDALVITSVSAYRTIGVRACSFACRLN